MRNYRALAPFKTRNFRFQWPADLCTAWALEMEALILGWYVLVETGSVVWLTVYGSLLFIGTLVSPGLGVLGDRWGLRTVVAGMRASYAVLAGVILLLAFLKLLSPTLVLVIAALSGLIRPSDIGMRNALVSASVPSAHMVSAMSISRTTQDTARIGGALLGTGFMALFGMVSAYLVICLFYLAGMMLTLQLHTSAPAEARTHPKPEAASPWRELLEGLRYIWNTPRLRVAILIATLVNLTAFPLSGGLMPYIARDVLGLNQQGLGWLVAAFGVGALIGSLALSTFSERIRPARAMLYAAVIWHVFLIGFVASKTLFWAIVLMAAAGLAQSVSMISLSILLLRTSELSFRGRIMGVRMLAIYTLPVGLMAAGAVIPVIGFHATAGAMLALGLVLLATVAYVWRSDLLPREALGNTR